MDRDQIKQGLKAKGCSFAIIAKVLNKAPSQVSAVAATTQTSREIAEAISKALDLPIKEVFPSVSSYHSPVIATSKSEQVEHWRQRLAS